MNDFDDFDFPCESPDEPSTDPLWEEAELHADAELSSIEDDLRESGQYEARLREATEQQYQRLLHTDDDDDEDPHLWLFDLDDDGEVVSGQDCGPISDSLLPPELAMPNLGPCCHCGATGPEVRNAITMDFTAPVRGTGWGCLVCHVPADGAIAVLCDACLEQWQAGVFTIDRVCVGYPSQGERIDVADYAHEPFGHDLRHHQYDMRTN